MDFGVPIFSSEEVKDILMVTVSEDEEDFEPNDPLNDPFEMYGDLLGHETEAVIENSEDQLERPSLDIDLEPMGSQYCEVVEVPEFHFVAVDFNLPEDTDEDGERPCLVTWIENAESVSIKCPVDCGAMLLQSEIRALIKPQVYERLEKLSNEKFVSDTPNAFRCQTSNCNGWCFFDDDSKVFLCPQCNKSNCIPCKAIHTGFSCEDYETEKKKCYESKIPNAEKHLRELVEKRSQTNGFEQLVASGWISTALEGPDGDRDKTKFYDTLITSMAKQRIFITTKEFECTICFCDVPPGGGVILQDCIHLFCKDCLISHIEHNDDPQVKCPHPGCSSILSPREIAALLPANVLEKVNKRSWSLAEAIIGSKFHCLTVDCSGFCELVGNVNAFQCPLCLKTNCIRCNAIHESVSCQDYKNRIVQNENDNLSSKAVDNLIATGMAMRCTKCTAPVQKDVGCDWIVCPMCRTELCWATKGPRWGPRGSGDISAGCKCRVGGKLCHPKCRNCH